MLLIWCVHSACDPIFGQRPTINSLYVQLWLRTYMCSTTKSQLHLTWLEVWWSLGSYPSIFHHAMRGDTLSHSIETIIWLMMIIWSDPSMFHDAVSPWSLHIYHYEAMQGQGPHFPPTRKATIHIHRGEGGKGVKMGTLHWGGVGGGACQTWIIYMYIFGHHIYIYIHIITIIWYKHMIYIWWYDIGGLPTPSNSDLQRGCVFSKGSRGKLSLGTAILGWTS